MNESNKRVYKAFNPEHFIPKVTLINNIHNNYEIGELQSWEIPITPFS